MMNLEKEIREQPGVLAGIREANRETLSALTAELKKRDPNSIFFAARGTSDHAAIYAQYLYGIYLGIPCGLATPSVISKYNGKLSYKNTVVFGISQSGKAEDVLAVINKAKADGSLTVAVTNTLESPLAKAADFHLYCNAGLEKSIAATKTFTAQMYVLALLCAEWSGNEELASQLEAVPGNVGQLLSYMPAELDKIISRYRYLSDAILVGRGFGYPIALEGALKVLETNRVRMKGYAISDFQHGPMAQVAPGTLVFVIAPEGPVFDDAKSILGRLVGLGAEVIVITDSDELESDDYFTLKIPKTGNDAMTPYLTGVTMQLFAMKLTEVKGIDPDKSNVLNKITVTI